MAMGFELAANTRLGFIGAGQMAEAIARGLNKAGVVSSDRMCAADINVSRCEVFESIGTSVCASNAKVISQTASFSATLSRVVIRHCTQGSVACQCHP